MLYNPGIDSVTMQFIEFVKGKPREEVFNYWNVSNCALAQFGREVLGIPKAAGGCHSVFQGEEAYKKHAPVVTLDERVAEALFVESPKTTTTWGTLSDRLSEVFGV